MPSRIGLSVLPAAHRMHRSSEFTSVVRGGERARARTVVVHHRHDVSLGSSAVVGLVVSKSVGGSVVRHRVSRRLRALLAARVDLLPSGSGTVVRALPAASVAPSGTLAADLDRALHRALDRHVTRA